MTVATFRFYEELNDFLPPRRRKCAFACVCASGATVKHAIAANPAGGVLGLEIRIAGDEVVIKIEDTGRGMADVH